MASEKTRLFIMMIGINLLIGIVCYSSATAERCEEWVGRAVSVQGAVFARKVGETRWLAVQLNDTFCPGDAVQVRERSRATVVLPNEFRVRLDQKTSIVFTGIERKKMSLLELLSGGSHFFRPAPRKLKLITPFVNAAVGGTEFYISVTPVQTFLSIFEGRVAAENAAGNLVLSNGESAIAKAQQAPVLRVVARPRDAVQWALYYPPVLDYRISNFMGGDETDWRAMMRRSIRYYRQGDLHQALTSLAAAPSAVTDPRFYIYRSGLLLAVGRVDEATADIDKALKLDPRNSQAFALQAVIAVVQNKTQNALELANKAVDLNPESASARIALSYVQQAQFDLQAALESVKETVRLNPENAVARA